MHARRSWISLVVVAASLSVVGAWTQGVAQSPVTELPRSNVSELITFVPPTAKSVGFTDWGRIKASQGAGDVTGGSPIDDKVSVVMSTNAREAAASGYGIAHLRSQYDTWGWDGLDLEWEATIQGEGPPLFVLRFRDGVDLGPIQARFDERGFSTTSVPGATIRSPEMALREDWVRAGEFAILNTAFLDDGRTLVLSVDLEQVQDMVANHGRYTVAPGVAATAGQLDGASALFLVPGLDACLGFTPMPIDPGDPLASPDLSMPTAGLHPYAALGVGYDRVDWEPIGRISLGYLDQDTAQSDLAGRDQLARDGISLMAGVPYADAAFQVVGERVDGTNLTFDVTPAGDKPRHLFDMVYARDMVFAGC
jgi:hypothetical protein